MKNLFSASLYIQGVKRIRTALGAFALTALVLNLISLFKDVDKAAETVASAPSRIISALLMPKEYFVVIVPILLTYCMFSYLNKRGGSDFYHSLAHKRYTVFVSFFAVVISAQAAVQALCIGCNAFVYAFVSGLEVSLGDVFLAFACSFSTALFMSACTAFAMMFTGTTFTAVFATVTLAFAPWLASLIFELAMMLETASFIRSHSLLRFAVNPMYPLTAQMFGGFRFTDVFVLYLAVAVLLSVGACIAYVKRKSETATNPTSGKVSDVLLRCAIPFLFAALWVTMYSGDISIIGDAALIIGVIAMVVYNAILCKSVKKALKQSVWFFAAIGIALVFVGVARLAGSYVDSNTPTVAYQVESVAFEQEYTLNSGELKVYANTPIRDEPFITEVVRCLNYGYASTEFKEIKMKLSLTDGSTLWRVVFLDTEGEETLERYLLAEGQKGE